MNVWEIGSAYTTSTVAATTAEVAIRKYKRHWRKECGGKLPREAADIHSVKQIAWNLIT